MKKKKKKKFYQYFNVLLLVVNIIFLILLYFTNVLNLLYFGLIGVVLVGLALFLIRNIKRLYF